MTNSAHMMIDFLKLGSLLTAVVLYSAALAILWQGLRQHSNIERQKLAAISLAASLSHLLGALLLMFTGDGQTDFSLFTSGSLIFATTSTMVSMSSFRKPVHALLIPIQPVGIGLIAASLVVAPTKLTQLSTGVSAHIVLSILAYGLITIATASALVMGYASYKLKHKQIHSLSTLMPPLETIERLLFEMILAGELFLTASIVTGFVFLDDFFAQHLAHKTFFSLLSWLIFAILLAGHHYFGWRGTKAMKLTIAGFVTLLLAYVGSKFVIELILGQA